MAPNFYSVILSCLPVVGKHGNQKKHGLHSAGVRSAKFCPWTVARRPCHQLCSHHASGANNIWDLLQKIGWNQGHIWDHLAVARCILYLSIQPKLPHDLLKIFPLFKLAKLIHTVLQTQKEQLVWKEPSVPGCDILVPLVDYPWIAPGGAAVLVGDDSNWESI